MTTYLLVIGLVVLPLFFYVNTRLAGAVNAVGQRGRERELGTRAERLSEVAPDKLPSAVAALIEAIPQRVTLIAPDGHVIDDTVLHGKSPRTEPLENHATRP